MARVTFDLRSVTIGPYDGSFLVTLDNPGDSGVKEAHVAAYFRGDQRVVFVNDPRIVVLGPNNRPLANAADCQTEALVAELKARGATAIEWAADDGPRREAP